MFTPQEVSTRSFPKSVMGGYNMAAVDEFLDQLTKDYAALYKENAALKAKMKVLVEKVEDYRATEDSMRATLLTAQKMADSIVREAEGKRDEVMKLVEQESRARADVLRQELQAENKRLQRGRRELSVFIEESRRLCNLQMELLAQLPGLGINDLAGEPDVEIPPIVGASVAPSAPIAPIPPITPVSHESVPAAPTVESILDSIAQEDEAVVADELSDVAPQEVEAPQAPAAVEEEPTPNLEDTQKFSTPNLDQLRFGLNHQAGRD